MAAERSNDVPPAPCVLTIGYGNSRSIDEFIAVLKRFGVEYLVDVRSKPYSRYRPEFSKSPLKAAIEQAGLSYVFMGDVLGGMPDDPDLQTNGRVDYEKIREQEWFNHALDRLQRGMREGHHLALMCAELEPQRCHRTKLVGEALVQRGVDVQHIDAREELITHEQAMARVNGGQGALFDEMRT